MNILRRKRPVSAPAVTGPTTMACNPLKRGGPKRFSTEVATARKAEMSHRRGKASNLALGTLRVRFLDQINAERGPLPGDGS